MKLSYVSALRITNLSSSWRQRSKIWQAVIPDILNYIKKQGMDFGHFPDRYLFHSSTESKDEIHKDFFPFYVEEEQGVVWDEEVKHMVTL